ncbi:MAG: calcium/sodium antiporter [Kofleriaceae bacterium]|nr:calcium/sodium antiporter [Myxococcales bacterium]MCB9565164.1 calcium/sodium antiporter [Kofleriaceae bacterium]MCB9572187.1 calcium/sodium antiporter [Kofleriaceae bacterium]
MLTTLDIVRLAVGILVLYWGAEWLIRGSATLARFLGVKPLVIGLTVVAYGTSAPELAVSTEAAVNHAQPIALGNVIGSCAANISLILGLTALIAPPTIDARIIRREVPILLGSAVAVPIMLRDGVISSNEGLILILCAALFTIVTLTVSSREDADDDTVGAARSAEDAGASLGGRVRPRGNPVVAMIMSAAGLGLLVLGSDLFVQGARGIGGALGMSERMLGLTIITLGTSLPELIASLVAATRGQSALAVGSVIGSNLLNVFLVLGVVAYLRPIHIGERMHVVDLVGLVAITVLGVIFMRGSRRISRVEGAILVVAYAGFITAAGLL